MKLHDLRTLKTTLLLQLEELCISVCFETCFLVQRDWHLFLLHEPSRLVHQILDFSPPFHMVLVLPTDIKKNWYNDI